MQAPEKSPAIDGRPAVNRTTTMDDVYEALNDLCAKLQIDTASAAVRVRPKKPAPSSTGKVHYAEMGRLLAAWYQNPRFLDETGNPKVLRITGRHSFAQLSRSVAPGISSSLLLAELKKNGAVTVNTSGKVRVQTRSLDVYTDSRLAVEYTLSSLVSYIRTLIHNLESNSLTRGQLFHRVAVNEEFDKDLVSLLNAYVRRQGEVFLVGFDNWMSRKAKLLSSGSKKRKKLVRATVGLYLSIDERNSRIRSMNSS